MKIEDKKVTPIKCVTFNHVDSTELNDLINNFLSNKPNIEIINISHTHVYEASQYGSIRGEKYCVYIYYKEL